MGRHPREVALRIRAALLRTYQANAHLLRGWYWHSALGRRTCLYCIAQHGRLYPLDRRLESHPNCRCTMLPATKTWEELGFAHVPETQATVQRGEDWFRLLDYDTKTAIMHPVAYEAYRSRERPLFALVRVRDDPRWGRSGGPAPLRDALGLDLPLFQQRAAEVAQRRRTHPNWFAARDEADRLLGALDQRLSGSRWRGELTLDPLTKRYAGIKRWACDIGIRVDVAASPTHRRHTITHELLHSYSKGVSPYLYDRIPGWEEGVVEALTRTLLPELAKDAGLDLDTKLLSWIYTNHAYNPYVDQLERLREMLGVPRREFYQQLLEMPYADRAAWMRDQGERLRKQERDAFEAELATTDKVMRQRFDRRGEGRYGG